MERVYVFLSELSQNNNREWFQNNKERYIEVQAIFNDFTEKLIDRISLWDQEIAESDLSVKDCTYRIYRDTRFSKDKSPYKTHMGAYICKKGKKSPYAGYYFHLEPSQTELSLKSLQNITGFLGNSLIAAGLYCPDAKVLQSLRDEISVNGDSILNAIGEAKGFELDKSNILKRLPRGFENVEERWQELLKHKDFSIGLPLPHHIIAGGNEELLKYLDEKFKLCHQFNRLMNLAVDFALDEM